MSSNSSTAAVVPPLWTDVEVSTRGRTLQVLTAVFGSISILLIGLRLFIRTAKKILGWDDYVMALTFVLLIPQMAFTFLEVPLGAGAPIATLGVLQISEQLQWVYITELFLFMILCGTKVSICLFVLRLKDTDKRLRYYLYFLMTGLVVTTIPVFIVWFAQCQPIHSFWDGNLTTKCWDQTIYNDLIWLQVSFSIFGDLSCSILPIVILYKIRIPTKLKVAICGLTALGLVATAAGIVRATLSPSDMVTDLTHDLALISIWATVEIHVGIFGANLALMRMVYVYFVEQTQASTSGYYGGNFRKSAKQGSSWTPINGDEGGISNNNNSTAIKGKGENYQLESGIRRTVDYHVTVERAQNGAAAERSGPVV